MLLEGSYMEISFGSKTSIGVIELTVNAAALADHLNSNGAWQSRHIDLEAIGSRSQPHQVIQCRLNIACEL